MANATVDATHCVCGKVVEGEDDDELREETEAHLATDHPGFIGQGGAGGHPAQADEI
jgi:hypothetical protein